MREHPNRDEWDENRIVLTIDEDEYSAYCSANAEGRIFIDGTPSRDIHSIEHVAPFRMDILLDEPPEDDEALVEDVAAHFNEQFKENCNEMYERIEESDDPLQEILDMEPDEVVVVPDSEEEQ